MYVQTPMAWVVSGWNRTRRVVIAGYHPAEANHAVSLRRMVVGSNKLVVVKNGLSKNAQLFGISYLPNKMGIFFLA